MRKSFAFVVTSTIALSACSTPEQRPLEYSVPASRQVARSALVEGFSALGYRIAGDTDFTVTVEQQQTPGEAILVNRRYSYQIAVVGDNPTKILPRIIMSQGREPNTFTVDVTDRAEVRSKLQSQMAPIIRGLGGNP